MMRWPTILPRRAMLALALLLPVASAAAEEDEFYRGKTVTIVIPIGPGGAYDAYARLLSRHLGKQLESIPGYPSARDYVMAVERGETDGGSSTYIGLSQLFSGYLREKKLNIPVQFALQRDPNMPDVPTVIELAKDADAVQV